MTMELDEIRGDLKPLQEPVAPPMPTNVLPDPNDNLNF